MIKLTILTIGLLLNSISNANAQFIQMDTSLGSFEDFNNRVEKDQERWDDRQSSRSYDYGYADAIEGNYNPRGGNEAQYAKGYNDAQNDLKEQSNESSSTKESNSDCWFFCGTSTEKSDEDAAYNLQEEIFNKSKVPNYNPWKF